MNHLKRIGRICALILFMFLAIAGMSMTGIGVVLKGDRKLFVDEETKIEMKDENIRETSERGKSEKYG